MEHLFSPCTRLNDLVEAGYLDDLEEEEEDFENVKELNLDVSPQELLSAERGFTYAHLYAMVESKDTVAWLTPHATIVRPDGRAQTYVDILIDRYCQFRFNVDDNEIIVVAISREHLLEICDVILRLLAASVVHSVFLPNSDRGEDVTINAPALEYLMEQCPSLKSLSMYGLEMDENHCRVLGAYSRPDLEIVLYHCKFTSTGSSALAEVLGHNQGPTALERCSIDYSILADGLRGNSRLKSFREDFSDDFDLNRQVLAIANALRENKGLVELDFHYALWVTDETWGAICDSLKTHPTLEVLNMPSTLSTAMTGPAIITSRIQALLDLMKLNLSIHTINLRYRYSHHELFRESVVPFLETNLFRPRLLAIQKTRPIAYRAKVLGEALLAVRTDPNRLWMLLSGNAEVAFPSTTTTTTPAANLPTPATASAYGATGGATNLVATGAPAANIATPASGQKRKM
jgi:hypothetical protein